MSGTAQAAGVPRRFDARGLVLPAALLVVAELGLRLSGVQSDSLAPPSKIALAIWNALIDGSLLTGTMQTVGSAIAGTLIGFTLGLALGILLGMFTPLRRLLEVTIETLRPIPAIALFPIALLIFGFGYRIEFATVAFATFWPTLILTRAAVAGVEPRLFEVARLLRLGFAARTFKIVLPAALPRIFVALRLAIGFALIIAITLEVSANTIGLGYAMMQAQSNLDPARMLAFLVWIGALGWMLNVALLALQCKLFGRLANEA